jgi:hypothetical protein
MDPAFAKEVRKRQGRGQEQAGKAKKEVRKRPTSEFWGELGKLFGPVVPIIGNEGCAGFPFPPIGAERWCGGMTLRG